MKREYLNFGPAHAATLDDSAVEGCYPGVRHSQQTEYEVSDSQPSAS